MSPEVVRVNRAGRTLTATLASGRFIRLIYGPPSYNGQFTGGGLPIHLKRPRRVVDRDGWDDLKRACLDLGATHRVRPVKKGEIVMLPDTSLLVALMMLCPQVRLTEFIAAPAGSQLLEFYGIPEAALA